jgi:hypothetical protein
MASFATHLYGAALVSSVAALGLYGTGLVGPQETQICFVLGVAGGLLPDIDADASKPVRGFFTLLAVVSAFLVAFVLVGHLALLELALTWLGSFLLVRFGFFEAFARLTVHRGIWHSWLAVALAVLVTANLADRLFGTSARGAWFAGGFTGLGYLTHLCLDELASVDLWGHRVRRSFGTALKPFSLAAPWASLAMFAVVLALAYTAPSLQPVLEAGRARGWYTGTLEARVADAQAWLAGLCGQLN